MLRRLRVWQLEKLPNWRITSFWRFSMAAGTFPSGGTMPGLGLAQASPSQILFAYLVVKVKPNFKKLLLQANSSYAMTRLSILIRRQENNQNYVKEPLRQVRWKQDSIARK
ncbi:hypothetical protein C5167_028880 [Papaver somniferum]|nr:hypothetical protein C5167_028880 [Papaver somniferum]